MSDPASRLTAALAGRYDLSRELGRGGMAVVYLARDLRHDREVALKVLRPELGASLGAERFLREIRIAAQLTHPHILPLYDSGQVEVPPSPSGPGGSTRFLYYVMPYIPGESLRDRLDREGQLGIEEALQIAREVGSALSHAHAQGLVHRDIKPENILLSGGHAVLADFGIARAVNAAGGERLTETGLSIGTPHYMSPEQAAGDGAVDGRSDQYALACVLYELLAGQPPFTGPTPMAVIARHTMDPMPSLRTVRATIPEALEGALRKGMAKVPADRFATVQQFVAALTGPWQGVAEGRARARRWRPPVVPGLLAAAVVAAGFFFGRKIDVAGLFTRRADQRVAVLDFDGFGVDSLSYLTAAIPEFLSLALTGEGSGPRALDRRVVSHAWTSMGATTQDPAQRRLALARRVGATHVVTGQVIQQRRDSVLVTATLYRGREEVTQARAMGPGRDAAALAEQVGVQLLAASAGEFGHLPGLVSSSTEAVQHWLAGQREYRGGGFAAAESAYALALDRDSTFALAAWGLMLSSAWKVGDTRDSAYRRGRELAWRYRGRLPRPDSLLFVAESYRNNYPDYGGERRALHAYMHAVQQYPERWDSWLRYGDYLWHEGGAVMDEGAFKAAQAFELAIGIDSTAGREVYAHLLEYAALTGDLELYDRLPDRYKGAWLQWYAAVARNDRAVIDSARPGMETGCWLHEEHLRKILAAGIGAPEWEWMAETLQRCAAQGHEESAIEAGWYLLNRGRPAQASRVLARPLSGRYDVYTIPIATFWNGDTLAARAAAERWEAVVRDAPALDWPALHARCLLGFWKIHRGMLDEVPQFIASMREASAGVESPPGPAGKWPDGFPQHSVRALSGTCAAVLEASLDIARGGDGRGTNLAQADSVVLYAGLRMYDLYALKIALARLHERRGEDTTALRVVSRRGRRGDEMEVYLSTSRLMQARLAARLGRRDEAIAAYDHYLTLMAAPEPALADGVQGVREELAALVGR